MTIERELKPCPFCGSGVGFIGEAKAFQSNYVGKIGHIICPKCFARAHGDMRTKEECITAWNTRPSQALDVEWPKRKAEVPDDWPEECFDDGWNQCHDAFMAKIKNVRGNE